jgi:hypothetical protein
MKQQNKTSQPIGPPPGFDSDGHHPRFRPSCTTPCSTGFGHVRTSLSSSAVRCQSRSDRYSATGPSHLHDDRSAGSDTSITGEACRSTARRYRSIFDLTSSVPSFPSTAQSSPHNFETNPIGECCWKQVKVPRSSSSQASSVQRTKRISQARGLRPGNR